MERFFMEPGFDFLACSSQSNAWTKVLDRVGVPTGWTEFPRCCILSCHLQSYSETGMTNSVVLVIRYFSCEGPYFDVTF